MIAGMSFSAGKIVVRIWNVLQKKESQQSLQDWKEKYQ